MNKDEDIVLHAVKGKDICRASVLTELSNLTTYCKSFKSNMIFVCSVQLSMLTFVFQKLHYLPWLYFQSVRS